MLTHEPIRIVVQGDFWDSHIYSGRLFLFGADNSLTKVNWPELVASQAPLQANPIAVNGLLVDAGFFYRSDSRTFMSDQFVSTHVHRCFADLQGQVVDVDLTSLEKVVICDSPFSNLHAGLEIYHHRIYAGMPEGLFLANSGVDDESASKLWDGHVYGVRASSNYGTVAVAAGDDGLWEYDIQVNRRARGLPELTNPAKEFCTACDWGDQSIFAWSGEGGGYLASFYTQRARGERKAYRVFDKTIQAEDLYGEGVSFWGSHDRAYALDGENLVVIDYDPRLVGEEKKLAQAGMAKGSIQSDSPLHDHTQRQLPNMNIAGRKPVAVATAPFGTALQFGNSLYVYRSDGGVNKFSGDIVTWKVFPRSLHYANQLHIVYEDRLEIIAFLHDYFVDQSAKLFGYKVRSD
jgi:hypothetical protein